MKHVHFLSAILLAAFASGGAMAGSHKAMNLCEAESDANSVAVAASDMDEDEKIAMLAMIDYDEIECKYESVEAYRRDMSCGYDGRDCGYDG